MACKKLLQKLLELTVLLCLGFIYFSSYPHFVQSLNDNFCDYCANKCNDGPNFHYWIIEEKEVAPDNFPQIGRVINGQFPGPTIRTLSNQYLVVKVENRLQDEGVSIHWHGLHQDHTLASDGTEWITQYEIRPNSTFTYCIRIGSQAGTFMYHAHSNLDIIWLQGALIIDHYPPSLFLWSHHLDVRSYFYNDERTIILGQLYHVPLGKLVDEIMVTGGQKPTPASLLINGKSYGEWLDDDDDSSKKNSTSKTTHHACSCGNNHHHQHDSDVGYHVTEVEWGVTYRFRVINLSSDQMLRFSIANHKMRVIEADGIYISPIDVDHLDIHATQRYSVIIKMYQDIDNYWMESKSIGDPGPGNGVAILHYIDAPDPEPLRTVVRPKIIDAIPMDEWVSSFIHPNPHFRQEGVYPVPTVVDRNIKIDFHMITIPPVQRFAINGHVFHHPKEPYLTQVRKGINVTDEPQVFEVIEGEGVQVILQNRARGGDSGCDEHPWHFHGRDFYVVAYGPDEYIEDRDNSRIEEMMQESRGFFQFRDVFVQYPQQTVENLTSGAGCGWYAVRFRANNPGLWLVHCHITPHMMMGKMFVLYEHSLDNPTLIGE